MPIIAKGSRGDFKPAPQGTFRAVCVDVVDLGEIDDNFGGKARKVHKIRILWQLDEPMEDGRFFVVGNLYTLSFNAKSNLRQMIEGWQTREFTAEDEAKGFDVETLLGKSGLVTVTHRVKEGKTFANAFSVAPLLRGMPPLQAQDYTRLKDRDSNPAPPAEAQEWSPPTDDDGEPPF